MNSLVGLVTVIIILAATWHTVGTGFLPDTRIVNSPVTKSEHFRTGEPVVESLLPRFFYYHDKKEDIIGNY